MRDFLLTPMPRGERPDTLSFFSEESAKTVRAFHQTLAGYAPTPLRVLDGMASKLGLQKLWVKDESYRFGLNAFKALGASYAVSRLSEAPKGLATATDGNHGRGVAWMARQYNLPCSVFLPKGSALERVENIQKEGAEAVVTDLGYDDCVLLARKTAEERGWTVVQDTAWEGYFDIPMHIMQGYMTMADEAGEQLQNETPTHIFLQAGVGSMAGAVAAYWKNRLGESAPTIVVVEPHSYNCFYKSALANEIRFSAEGDTIMAGLACGEPNPVAWEILKYAAKWSMSLPEYAAASAMRALAEPLPGDAKIVSGESGAAPFGAVYCLMTLPGLREFREKIGLDENSRVLVFSTEGATDRENYEAVLNGKYPLPEEAK